MKAWRWHDWASVDRLDVCGKAWLIGGTALSVDLWPDIDPWLALSCVLHPYVLGELHIHDPRVWEGFVSVSEHGAGVLIADDEGERLDPSWLVPPAVRDADHSAIMALTHDLPGWSIVTLFDEGVAQSLHLPDDGVDRQSTGIFMCDVRGRGLQPDQTFFTFDRGGMACWSLDSVEDWLRDREMVVHDPSGGQERYHVRSQRNNEYVRNSAYFRKHGSAWREFLGAIGEDTAVL